MSRFPKVPGVTRPILSFVDRLIEGKPLIGTLISVRGAEVAEALSLCGYDWLFLDLEHSTLDIALAQQIIQATCSHVYTAIRIGSNSVEHFKKALDTGCDAIIVPLVNSKEEAEHAVRCAKYPPEGSRSVGFGRAQGYGLSFAEYVASANRSVALILQIEHIDAVHAIDEILGVPHFDGIFVGPFDLSASMGLLGQTNAPKVKEAILSVRAACTKVKMPFGSFCTTVESARAEIDAGGVIVCLGTDLSSLTTQARTTLAALAQVGRATTVPPAWSR